MIGIFFSWGQREIFKRRYEASALKRMDFLLTGLFRSSDFPYQDDAKSTFEVSISSVMISLNKQWRIGA